MAKHPAELWEVQCPCCEATLKIDPETRAVISHKETAKKPVIEDLAAAAKALQGEAARRDEAFRKSFENHQQQGAIREKKFDELLRQAKEDKEKDRPKRAFDFD